MRVDPEAPLVKANLNVQEHDQDADKRKIIIAKNTSQSTNATNLLRQQATEGSPADGLDISSLSEIGSQRSSKPKKKKNSAPAQDLDKLIKLVKKRKSKSKNKRKKKKQNIQRVD